MATLAMVGSPAQPKPFSKIDVSPPPEPADSYALRAQGKALYNAGKFADAIRIFRNGAEAAHARHDPHSQVRFLNNLGGAELGSFRYRDAIRSFLEVRELATANRNLEMLAVACLNLSSLYLEMNDLDGGLESARAGTALPPGATRKYRAQLLMLTARIRAHQKNVDGAVALEYEAIEESRAQENIEFESKSWIELGAILLDADRPAQAEPAILEGYRLRRLQLPGEMMSSYLLLGRLKVQQGDPAGARVFFDLAVQAAREAGPPSLWDSYYERGRGWMAEARWKEAYRDLRAALQYLEAWRAEVLPADAFRVSSENELQEIYSAFIDAAAHLYNETGKREFAEAALAASETNRAASLRALWAGGDLTATLPPEYGETLAALRRTETAMLKAESETLVRDAARLRLRLAEMEARAGLDVTPSAARAPGVGALQQTLNPDELLLAFHSGKREFYCWAVTRERLQFTTISGGMDLKKAVQRFIGELRENSPSASSSAAAIYTQVFAGVDATLLAKPMWIVAPDGPLFELPFSALIESTTGTYVVERHAVREVPGISALGSPNPSRDRSRALASEGALQEFSKPTLDHRPWVAVGDPIYNRADPRRAAPARNASPNLMELARLTGSGREVDACARIWRSRGLDAALLKGAHANRRNLLAAIGNSPPVLHIATHILFPAKTPGPGMLALSQEPAGGVDLLSASEVSRLRATLDLVVVDGCSSGTGPVLPGTGLMGLTRAWLAAGARAIVVTRWPAADRDAGELFLPFYENLPAGAERVSISRVLQQAQIARLRAGGPGARPANWASYFCVERN